MIRKRPSQRRGNYFSPQVGWLFADLLLAIAMIFLITNTSTEPLAHVSPTPTPQPTPTPASSSPIEQQYTSFRSLWMIQMVSVQETHKEKPI